MSVLAVVLIAIAVLNVLIFAVLVARPPRRSRRYEWVNGLISDSEKGGSSPKVFR